MDTDGSGYLSLQEFENCLKKVGMPVSRTEAHSIFKMFDLNQDNLISSPEFMNMLKQPLNERRKNMVLRCFQQIDVDGSGVVELNDLKDIYNASQHPDVKKGKKSERQVLTEFLNNFEGTSGNKDGKVTLDEFIGY